jgi:hypothetical protein
MGRLRATTIRLCGLLRRLIGGHRLDHDLVSLPSATGILGVFREQPSEDT